MASLPALRRSTGCRAAFEKYVRRTWHEGFRPLLKRNSFGAYPNFDVQQAWLHWQAGWRSRSSRG